MKSGVCPKCGSTNIYCNPNRQASGYTGSRILIKLGWFANKSVNLIHYVCKDCSYIESYIADKQSIQNIGEEWVLLNPQKSKRKNDE